MSQISIDRSHRLGKQKGPGQKPRAIIVKLHDTKTGMMSLEIKYFYRKPYSKKDGTP